MALAVCDSVLSSPLSQVPTGGSSPSLAHSRTSSLLKKKGISLDVGCSVHPHSCCYLRISRSRIASMEPQTGGTAATSKRHGGWGIFGGPPFSPSSRILASTSPTFTVTDVDVETNDKLPPLPDKRVLGGVGTVTLDFLASVASFPDPDSKIRSLNSLAQGGGNVGNALTAAARLGLRPRIFSKLANDAAGIGMLKEFESNGVDVSHIVCRWLKKVSLLSHMLLLTRRRKLPATPQVPPWSSSGLWKEMVPPTLARMSLPSKSWYDCEELHMLELFLDPSYHQLVMSFNSILSWKRRKTRTCIHTPGYPPLEPKELGLSAIASFLDGVDLLYLDGRIPDAALLISEQARKRQLPMILDAERKREGLDEMLPFADYLVTSAKFPQVWTEAPSLAEALISLAVQLPRLKFVIVTQGSAGCVMLERSSVETTAVLDPNSTLLSLQKEAEQHQSSKPVVFSSKVGVLQRSSSEKSSSEAVVGRLLVGTAALLSSVEVVDTTGAGDAFIGGIAYGILADFPPEKMLPLGAAVAAAKCQALGARTGLPLRSDPRLLPVLM